MASGGPNRKHRLQQSLYCCYRRLCSDSLDIVSAETCLPSRYQATYVPSRDRCVAMVLHVTV
jgi:hypothetical protein